MMKKLLYLLPLLWAVSCGTHNNRELPGESEASYGIMAEMAMSETRMADQDSEAIPNPTQAVALGKKKIIREGRMGIQTSDLVRSKSEINALVAKYGGYYADENYDDDNYGSSFNLEIRIPEANYEKFVSEIESGGGKVTFKSIQARDVTEQFVDLEVRLGNKRAYLQRYRDLVKQARNIEEILQVEKHVRLLEEEIESAEGRLRYLSDRASYSTLNLQLTQPKPYKSSSENRIGFWEKFTGSVTIGWRIVVEVFLFLVKLWPFWLIGGGVAWLIVHRERHKKQPKK